MECAVAGDQTAEADYIRAILAMKRVAEQKTMAEAFGDVSLALQCIKSAHDKEPDNKLYNDYYQTLEQILKTEEKRKRASMNAIKKQVERIQRDREARLEREAHEAEQFRKAAEKREMKDQIITWGGGILGVLALIYACTCCYACGHGVGGCLGC